RRCSVSTLRRFSGKSLAWGEGRSREWSRRTSLDDGTNRKWPGVGDRIRVDNGAEFVSQVLAPWACMESGGEIGVRADFAQSHGGQAARRDIGMPRPVMMLITLQATWL